MPVLYIANKNYSSWSLVPWVLLRERGVPFEEKLVPFHAAPFTTFSPSGKVPCLIDGAITVWDSAAIIEYLAESHPELWPAERAARAFARSVAAEMHSGFMALRTVCGMNCGLRVRLRAIDAALGNDLARLDAVVAEGRVRFGGPFLAGAAFSGADAVYAPVAFRLLTYAPPVAVATADYFRRVREVPSMRAWYAAALAETWRDAGHDAEILEYGTISEDLRARA
ncbi:MAG TPA: glutathione S-transferase [Rhodanobacteraceae bacterium]|nr:glutathione S-transferase [Rhodanobacteraceae bacterium]